MREIHRTIVSAIVVSKDGKVLMGKKDPEKGGVYSEFWHIPGGGVEEGESLENALLREVYEETGLDISSNPLVPIPEKGFGTSEKTMKDSNEKVLCYMEFNRFLIRLDKNSTDIPLNTDGDLQEIQWFSKDELRNIRQIPDGVSIEQYL